MLVRDFLQPATVFNERSTVADAASVIQSTGSAYLQLGASWYVVQAQSLIGYPTTRRLIDVPLEAVEPIGADEDIDVVLSAGSARDLLPVSDRGAVVGCVDRRKVLDAFAALASPEELGLMLLSRLTPMLLHDISNSLTVAETAMAIAEHGDPKHIKGGREALRQALTLLHRARTLAIGVDDAEPLAFDVRATLHALVPSLEAAVASMGHLTVDIADDVPSVRGYPRAVERCILNLVLNARDAAGERGKVALAAARGADGSALIRVDDDGPGIPAGMADRLFEIGFSTKGGALRGFGLPAVARALHRFGGSIAAVDSLLGGAGFLIMLPGAI